MENGWIGLVRLDEWPKRKPGEWGSQQLNQVVVQKMLEKSQPSLLPWGAATYQAAGTSRARAARGLLRGPGSALLSQAPVLLRELVHLALQADLRQLQLVDAAAQLLQLPAEAALGGALLLQAARRLVSLALAALGPLLPGAQLRGRRGGAPGTGRDRRAGAARGRGVQLGQQEARGAAEAPHVPLQPLYLRPQSALLLAQQTQLAPLGPPVALQGRRLPPQRLVSVPQSLPQPPQPPPLPLGRALLFQNLQAGGG